MGSFLFEILDFVVLVLFVVGLLRRVGSMFRATRIDIRTSGTAKPPPGGQSKHHGEMARDPICGMFVSTELPYQIRQGGDVVHFCSRECLEKFRKETPHVASSS